MANLTFQVESQFDSKPIYIKKTYTYAEINETTPAISVAEGEIEISVSHLNKVNLLILDARNVPVGSFLKMTIVKDDGVNPPMNIEFESNDWMKLSYTDSFGSSIKKIKFETDSVTEFKFYLGVFSI